MPVDASFPVIKQVEGAASTGDVDTITITNSQGITVYRQRISNPSTDAMLDVMHYNILKSAYPYSFDVTENDLLNYKRTTLN